MALNKRQITISIVSHYQEKLIKHLLDDLENFCNKFITVIITINIEEKFFLNKKYSFPIFFVKNINPKGYGSNHNYAFMKCSTKYFCVANPDIRLNSNPFASLTKEIELYSAALISPMVINEMGDIEESVRKYPSISSLFLKFLNIKKEFIYNKSNLIINPDWVGGMFMLFNTEQYRTIGGFDERYFLYCEDVDICRSLLKSGNSIIYSPNASVIHSARRSSHKNIRYFLWHLTSFFRFFIKWNFLKKIVK